MTEQLGGVPAVSDLSPETHAMHHNAANDAERLNQRRLRPARFLFWVLASATAVAMLIGLPILVLLLTGATSSDGNGNPSPDPWCEGPVARLSVSDLDSEQVGHAKTIISVGQEVNVPAYGWVVALTTALQESKLVNLRGGDRDSLGLFQQRPSSGWGDPADIMNPRFAARAFYGGPSSPHWRAPINSADPPGLQDITGWESMTVTEAAQAVQRSAYPDEYAQWEPLARALVSDLTDAPDNDLCGNGKAMTCASTDMSVEAGLTPDALRVLRCLVQHWPQITEYHGVGDRPTNSDSDHTTGRAVDAMIPKWHTSAGNVFGWEIAEWLQQHASSLGIRYIIWDAKIWSVKHDAAGWRTYDHPSGNTDPTHQHLDHIHVSVYGDSAGQEGIGEIVLPLDPGHYRLTAGFGECGQRWAQCHTGLDFAADAFTIVKAVAAGEVVSAEDGGAYGYLVKILHTDGTETWYAHLYTGLSEGLVTVEPGQTVTAGQAIGQVGTSGNTTNPHLHLEIRPDRGAPVDPETWLAARGVDP